MNNRNQINNFLVELQSLDYEVILSIIAPIISLYIGNKTLAYIDLKKAYKDKDISEVSKTPKLVLEHESVINLNSEKFSDDIYIFCKTIMENFKMEDLTNFYNNISSLNVVYKNFKFSSLLYGTDTLGEYNAKKNLIRLSKNDCDKGTIFHELFHMSSSIFYNNIEYSGFEQVRGNGKFVFGKGINEGYTELLTRRYFNKYVNLENGYPYECHICECLEKIIGEDKMKSLYLNSNLYGLINELELYMDTDSVLKFINSVDFVSNEIYSHELISIKKKMIKTHLEYIYSFLLKCYLHMMKRKLDNHLIDTSSITISCSNYISFLGSKIGEYECLNYLDTLNLCNDVFSNCNIKIKRLG